MLKVVFRRDTVTGPNLCIGQPQVMLLSCHRGVSIDGWRLVPAGWSIRSSHQAAIFCLPG